MNTAKSASAFNAFTLTLPPLVFQFSPVPLFCPNPGFTAYPFLSPDHFFGYPPFYRFVIFPPVPIFSPAPFLPAGCFYQPLLFRLSRFFGSRSFSYRLGFQLLSLWGAIAFLPLLRRWSSSRSAHLADFPGLLQTACLRIGPLFHWTPAGILQLTPPFSSTTPAVDVRFVDSALDRSYRFQVNPGTRLLARLTAFLFPFVACPPGTNCSPRHLWYPTRNGLYFACWPRQTFYNFTV